MTEPIHIISLGAGVQSSAMALMAARGELTPMPDAAIFADTQAEPESVYRSLRYLAPLLPFPIIQASKGNLGEAALRVRTSKGGTKYTKHAIPAFIIDPSGRIGLMMRQCTSDFKIEVIHREIRKLTGGGNCVQWIGISLDEAHRMKPSRKKYIANRWPLIDMRLSRRDCLAWMKANGFEEPPRSSCVFCPYHSDREWRRLQTSEPKDFQRAVEWEKAHAAALKLVPSIRGTPYLHRSCKPLGEIDFSAPSNQSDMFANECEGVCGV